MRPTRAVAHEKHGERGHEDLEITEISWFRPIPQVIFVTLVLFVAYASQ
jgi:hypothetical protein